MNPKKVENSFENNYHVSWYIIFYKFSLGFIELLFGLGILFFGQQILRVYQGFVSQELFEDPHDLFVHLTLGIIPHLLTHNMYLVVYLILLGFVKVAGSIGLLFKQNWGADALVILTIVLFPFQLFNLLLHPNLFDLVYIVVGIVIALYIIEFKPRAWISQKLNVLFHYGD